MSARIWLDAVTGVFLLVAYACFNVLLCGRMSQPTVQIPVETIDKLAALGKAMLSLADDLRKHVEPNVPQKLDIPIPDLTRPETIPDELAPE